jgi:asparagine synthase (glutamine-hydrolysing)
MCGIFGCAGGRHDAAQITAGIRRLAHRGPDGEEIRRWAHEGEETWLAFRRLAILDLSPRGMQPMTTERGDTGLVFNGEIYNFRELRRELEGRGHRFVSDCDSEVVLRGYEEWGTAAVERFVGMFAFAIWDARRQRLVLARDRLGIKPLYYHQSAGQLAFASEVKALLALPEVERRLDPDALARYLTFLWVPEPDTLLAGVRQLEAGTVAVYEAGELRIERYWDVPLDETPMAEGEAADALDALIEEAVRLRLVSDVPLGAFLSGGIDSSLIVALMRKLGVPSIITQTAVAPAADARYDIESPDAPFARAVRDHFGDLDYGEIELRPDVARLLPELSWHLDDPVADPAAIPTLLICRAARSRATVMLSGMGAEELFAGYGRHQAAVMAERYARLPRMVRGVVEPLVRRLPGARPGPWLRYTRGAKKFFRSAGQPLEQRYLGYASYYTPAQLAEVLGRPVDSAKTYARHNAALARTVGLDPVRRMSYLDLKTFLPSLNLAYTDRASMAASVEVRVPLLDHRVVEFVARLPSELKLRGRTRKYLLREVARRHLPAAVIDRPKTGFAAPVRAWVARDLREMIGDLLAPDRLRRRGVLQPEGVWAMVEDVWQGREDNALQVWAFLQFELWAQTFLDADGRHAIAA